MKVKRQRIEPYDTDEHCTHNFVLSKSQTKMPTGFGCLTTPVSVQMFIFDRAKRLNLNQTFCGLILGATKVGRAIRATRQTGIVPFRDAYSFRSYLPYECKGDTSREAA